LETFLSDQLLRDLIDAGQADVLVGIPTLNNAATIGPVVGAVAEAFAGPLLRERTVMLNADGGSTDGTGDIVRGAALPKELVVARHPLRTMHKISAPYHGLPGRAGALRIIFAAAELLGVRAVAVVDPDDTSLSAARIFHFIEPVLRKKVQLVKPVLARSPWEGPLLTQLVRPLMRALFGKRLLEPADTLFACSGSLAADALADPIWEKPWIEHGLDVWLAAKAMTGNYSLAQVPMSPRSLPDRPRRPPLHEVFQQLGGSLIESLQASPSRWQAISASEDVPVFGAPLANPETIPNFDLEQLSSVFAEAIPQLTPLLGQLLPKELVDALSTSAAAPQPGVGDELWVKTVYELCAAAHHQRMGTNQIVQVLLPIYEGRVAHFLREASVLSSAEAGERLEALCLSFEQHKPVLINRWNEVKDGH
jgi:hypothetical protein